MSAAAGAYPLVRCADCLFWAQFNPTVGLCRRRAPRPAAGNARDTVAHWPETFAEEGCGDGRARGTAPGLLACAGCAFWMQGAAERGLEPMNYNDQRRTWWQQAGRCVRHAPEPLANPGARLLWPATHGNDGCGDGTGRGEETPAFLHAAADSVGPA